MVKDLCPELSQEGLGELPDEETELLLPNEVELKVVSCKYMLESKINDRASVEGLFI